MNTHFPVNSKNIFYSLHHRGGQFPTNSPSFSLIQGQIEPNSPRVRVHIDAEEQKTGDVCRNTSVSRALYRRLFVYLLCRYEGRETRSNQMHFTIEFQAGEEESDSHLRGKREKKIWERETRGAWRSAATVSVCLMLIERCGSSCTPQLFRLRYYGFCASNISRLFFISRKNCQLHLTFCAFKWKIWTNENL